MTPYLENISKLLFIVAKLVCGWEAGQLLEKMHVHPQAIMQMEIDMRLFPFDTQRLNIVLGQRQWCYMCVFYSVILCTKYKVRLDSPFGILMYSIYIVSSYLVQPPKGYSNGFAGALQAFVLAVIETARSFAGAWQTDSVHGKLPNKAPNCPIRRFCHVDSQIRLDEWSILGVSCMQ